MALPETAISESAALRLLDMPTTRRAWLRKRLPSVPVAGVLIYERQAVEALRTREAAATSTRAAEPAPRPPTPLHTR